jgi:hypothetical protein
MVTKSSNVHYYERYVNLEIRNAGRWIPADWSYVLRELRAGND